MLTRPDDLIIGQPAHAWVSGQLARAWGNRAFAPPAPREPVCLAAEQHDVGWADADLEPPLGPGGRPLSFLEYPRPLHVAIWRDAARRLLAQSRYAALLVSLHGTSLYARIDVAAQAPDVAGAIRSYLEGEQALQARLAAGLDAQEVDRNRRLILALDRLSLALCHGEETRLDDVPSAHGPATIHVRPAPRGVDGGGPGGAVRDDGAVPADAGTAAFELDPWPFSAARVVVGCEARRLPGAFPDAAALREALAAAPWVPLRFALSPGRFPAP